jgi:hypothetical protein
MALTKEKIDELKAQNGSTPLAAVGDLIVFKRPSRAEYDRWVDAKVSGGSQSTNARQLAQACLVYPSWDDFIALLNERPSLLLNECLDALIELSGVDGEESKLTVKKL